MYVTELRGLRIISLVSALKMGQVEDVLLDPTCRYVAALRVHTLNARPRRLVLRQMVKRVGRHAVILGGSDEPPEEATLENADRLVSLHTMLGLEVVTDQGNLVGRIRNATIDSASLVIETYEIARNPLGHLLGPVGGHRVSAQETVSGSKDVLLIPEAALLPEGAPEREAHMSLPGVARWSPTEMPSGRDGAGAALG